MGDLRDIKVGILKGGISGERKISFLSGEQASLALRRKGINVVDIIIDSSDESVIKSLICKESIDLAFIALHGEFGEDGGIQSILDDLDIPYTGSSPRASYLAMNKIASKIIFIKRGIPTPSFFVLDRLVDIDDEMISFPKVVKPYYSGSSLGVSIVKNYQDYRQAIIKAFTINDRVIVEDYIYGKELTVGILDDKPLSVVEIIPKQSYYDFDAKYTDGLSEFNAPAPLPSHIYKKIMEIGFSAHSALGCRHFSRVDIRLDPEGIPFVLEVNTIPGLTSHSLLPLCAKVCGIGFDELILKMVELAYNEKKKEQRASV
ncbi:MAG: D-alanine--D-alanine ligase [Candidatus Omnitrophica bacterium]|nr:D-alanine--D-alanine ligase [Candidatus Omnitrophota bacterium]MCM8827482.1 D-alanine--D-alanine ligase [Candidatus Omnitrophota bacterium]